MFLLVSCTIAVMESEDRKRLAQAVIARRVELGMKTTKALADKAGLSARMLGDVENGRRDNFSDGAKAQIERALRWDAGSIDDVLSGKSPAVSGSMQSRSGRTILRWTAIEGAEQVELELYRLAYLVMDTRDLVRSQHGPLKNAVTALLDEANDLVLRQVARWRSGQEEIDAKALTDAQWFVDETRNSNTIRRQGDIYVIDNEPSIGLQSPTLSFYGAGPDTVRDNEPLGVEKQLIEEELLGHYVDMFLRALEQQSRKILVEQARDILGDSDPNRRIPAELSDELYVRYIAARHSTAYQHGAPHVHAATGLSPEQSEAGAQRYRRERSEMILFDGRIRTVGADTTLIANAIKRVAPDGYEFGRAEQGEADGEESQDPDGSR